MPDPIPAIRKVQIALQTLVAAALNHQRVFLDRGLEEPLQESEQDGIVIRVSDLQFGVSPENMGNTTLNSATIDLDLHARYNPTLSIGAANELAAAKIVAALGADRTLGGRLQNLEEDLLSPSDPSRVAVGCATLTLDVQYFTPRGDPFTIVGLGGGNF